MKHLVLALGIIVCLASVAAADEAELPAQKDTYIHEGTPDLNHGNLDHLDLFADWAHPGAENPSTILIRFDLAPYMGTVINDAVLRLYVLPTGLQPGDVDIYLIADGWDENTVTWNNAPPDDQSMLVTEPLPPTPGVWFEVPVTGFVQNWVDGSVPNHGFYLSIPDQGREIIASLASKEHPDPGIHPILWLDYNPSGVSEEHRADAALHLSPISSGVEIECSLPSAQSASLKVYDASGSLVATLLDGSVSAGSHQLTWSPEIPGVYFVRLQTSEYTFTQKAVLTR